jgi:pimeloyl-ACP methyl ester carboxylesterase
MRSPSPTAAVVDSPPGDPGVGAIAPGPRWFGPTARPLFGWVHEPTGGGPSGVAVLCPPLFGEKSAVHSSYRTLAQDLSAKGHWVVRFDYEGTGDSSGPTGGPGRPAAWLASIDQALELARHCTGGPVALVGMRMGALLAAVAAGRGQGVDALVLWDPCLSGRSFLRRHQAIQAMRFPPAAGWRGIEVPGYALDEAMAGEVAALRLPEELRAGRSLVVSRPGGDQPALGAVSGADAPEHRCSETGEQEALLEAGHLRRVPPLVTTGLIVDWLDETLRRAASPAKVPGTPGSREAARRADRGEVSTVLEVEREPSAVLGAGAVPGTNVVERVRWFGPVRLFGIETEAEGGGDTGDLPVVVLLSSGSDSHVGPSRLWVRLARAWAATGTVRCVRVDLSGWGESPSHLGREESVLRPVEAFDDVREVLAAIGRPDRVLLLGLCSGAYQALESALEVPPAAVLAVNPLLRFTPPELMETGSVSPRRRICDPKQPWVHSVRSKLPRSTVHLMAMARSAVSRLRFAGRVEEALGGLVAAGVRVYCICGDDDARQLLQVRRRTRAAWRSSGHVRVDVLPGLDHALLPRDQREEVCDRLTGELRRVVAALVSEPPADGVEGLAAVGTS